MTELHNVEATYDALRSNPADVVVSSQQAAEIYAAFTAKSKPTANFQDFKYRAFLQAAMIGWIDASAGMGFIKALLTSSMKPTATITGILKALLKEALKQYYDKEVKGTPELSIAAGNTILWANRTYFDMIGEGLELP